MHSRSTGELNSNRVTSSLLRKRTRLPTHAHEVRALTFEVTDNFGSNDVLPCGACGPRPGKRSMAKAGMEPRSASLETDALPLRQQGCDHIACLFVGCLTYQQHASVSQGRICSDKLTCCHTEMEVADQTFYLTQSQNTDTGPSSPSADPITPGAWQGSHWSANFEVTGITRPRKNPGTSGIRTRDLPRTPYH